MNMFGGARRSAQERPAQSAPAPSAPTPTVAQTGSFVVPEWCAAPTGPSLAAQLLVWRGTMLLETIPLRQRAFFIAGRLPESDIVLEHASASRQHAAIVHHRSGALYLIDLGSAHGTFLGGDRLSSRDPSLWTDGTPCVFGASSRTYVLQMRPDGRPLVSPHASIAPRPADPAGAPALPLHRPSAPSSLTPAPLVAPPLSTAEKVRPPSQLDENGGSSAACGAAAVDAHKDARAPAVGTDAPLGDSDAEAGESELLSRSLL